MSVSDTVVAPTSDTVVDGRYVILSVDGHAGADGARLPRLLGEQVPRRVRRVGEGVREPLRRPARRDRVPQLGLASAALEETEPTTASRPRCCSRTPSRRSSRAGTSPRYPPKAGEHELRWEGLKAHNRWLADFCNDAPGPTRRHGADPASRRRRRGERDPVGTRRGPVRRHPAPRHPARQRAPAVDRHRVRADLGHVRRARHAHQPPRGERRARLRPLSTPPWRCS